MEDNTVMNEIEEIQNVDEVAAAQEESSNSGAFVAGVIGGFLAYAFVSGAKKLAGIVGTKLEERKLKKQAATATIVEAEIVGEETAESDEESQNN